MPKDLRTEDIKNNAYFASLPKLIQEGVMQSAFPIYNEEELRSIAQKLVDNTK